MFYTDDLNEFHYKKDGDVKDYVIAKNATYYYLMVNADCLRYTPSTVYDGLILWDDIDKFDNKMQAVRYIKEHTLI